MGFFESYIAPTIGVVLANTMFLSSLPAVMKVRSTQQLGELNPLPYPVIAANCIGWCIYATLTQDIFILLGNLPGTLLGIFFTLTSVGLTCQKIRDLITIASLIFPFVFISQLFVLSMIEAGEETFQFAQGLTNNIVLIVYYAAPLWVFKKVIQTRNSASLYFPLVLTNLINACMWFIYGLVALQDPFIWVPNAVGFLLNVFAIFLIFVYPRENQQNSLLRYLVVSCSFRSNNQREQQREEQMGQNIQQTDSTTSDSFMEQIFNDTKEMKTVGVEVSEKDGFEENICTSTQSNDIV